MSTRGWQDVTMADVTRRELKQALKPKGSKYKNVKTVHDGITFDSAKEAQRYVELRARLKAGEIRDLRVQLPFDLLCPDLGDSLGDRVVAVYVADFVYEERTPRPDGFAWCLIVEDVKGKRTQMYQLKKKWLELQTGIVIREV